MRVEKPEKTLPKLKMYKVLSNKHPRLHIGGVRFSSFCVIDIHRISPRKFNKTVAYDSCFSEN